MSQPITLVIADDHPLFRKGLREVVESDTALQIVGEAADGAAALAIIQQHTPAIAVLDIDMPQMGGLTVASEIRQRKLDVDVIFLTMYREEDLFNEAMDVGARAYVLKDSAVNDILNAIHAVSNGRYYISPGLSDHLIKRSARAEKLLRHTPSLEDLTPAELRILKLIAENKTSKEVADLLSISYKTVENHRTNIASKLHLRGSHSLLKFALENKNVLARNH
jgi:DNA-binding NarL/FixJ family response regulator